ncbi:unnamed protein product [Closterium sp. NIES-65]|nr:unnamed protein product [Closterium sp. NIES-65]
MVAVEGGSGIAGTAGKCWQQRGTAVTALLIDSTTVILKTTATNENACCQTCAQADKCVFFHYQPPTELYMTWRDPIGRQHSVFLKARDGQEQRRGERGFIERMEMDGRPLTPPTLVGQAVQGEGDFHMVLAVAGAMGDGRDVGQAVHGEGAFHMVLAEAGGMGDGRDRDTYRVRVGGVASMELSLHAAHPLLQTADEAYTHFNVYIKYLNVSIQKARWQTFRGEITRAKRAEEYGLLTRLLRAPIQADGETGRGFLDGDVEDYATSAIDAADCAFATAWNEARRKVRDELGEVGEEQGASGEADEEARGEVEEAEEEVQKEVWDEAGEEHGLFF